MHYTIRRPILCAVAFALLATSCASAQGFEFRRVQNDDVSVLPGGTGAPHPLTGVRSDVYQPWQDRSVLSLKVGNSSAEHPQSGLDRADVVYEELVEGGVTRFLALFSTNQSDRVGPIRSARLIDPLIVAPLGGLFGYSGGVPPVIEAIRATEGVTDVGGDRAGGAYRRDGSRRAPYNLYARTNALWEGRSGSPPPPLFDFLRSSDAADTGGTETANDVSFSFANNSSNLRYVYDSNTGRYSRYRDGSPHQVEDGEDAHLSFRNVVVQMVEVRAGEIVDRGGARSPEADLIGSGAAVVFRGGTAVRGRWERSSAGERTRFLDGSGNPLGLAPGKTIVHLLPSGRDIFVS